MGNYTTRSFELSFSRYVNIDTIDRSEKKTCCSQSLITLFLALYLSWISPMTLRLLCCLVICCCLCVIFSHKTLAARTAQLGKSSRDSAFLEALESSYAELHSYPNQIAFLKEQLNLAKQQQLALGKARTHFLLGLSCWSK